MIKLLIALCVMVVLPYQVLAEADQQINKQAVLVSSPVEVTAVFQVIIALLFIIIIIFGLAWVYKRYGGVSAANGAAMKVLGAISLGGKEKAVLLQVGDEQVLVGVSPGYVRKIHDIKNPVIVEAENESNSFVSKLNSELQKVISR